MGKMYVRLACRFSNAGKKKTILPDSQPSERTYVHHHRWYTDINSPHNYVLISYIMQDFAILAGAGYVIWNMDSSSPPHFRALIIILFLSLLIQIYSSFSGELPVVYHLLFQSFGILRSYAVIYILFLSFSHLILFHSFIRHRPTARTYVSSHVQRSTKWRQPTGGRQWWCQFQWKFHGYWRELVQIYGVFNLFFTDTD